MKVSSSVHIAWWPSQGRAAWVRSGAPGTTDCNAMWRSRSSTGALEMRTPAVAYSPEARAVTALNHPHIVVVHDVLTVNERDVLVMEFVSGEALRQVFLLPA